MSMSMWLLDATPQSLDPFSSALDIFVKLQVHTLIGINPMAFGSTRRTLWIGGLILVSLGFRGVFLLDIWAAK